LKEDIFDGPVAGRGAPTAEKYATFWRQFLARQVSH
jgi:hypothetical protein